MPYHEPDETDPMELQAIEMEADEDATAAMAANFIEEYLRIGYGADRVLSMFKMPQFIGPHRAYQALGEDVISRMIDEFASLWGGRRDGNRVRRDAYGNVISA